MPEIKEREYDRVSAVEYARKWALARNSRYYNFDSLGGDCTNFASQALYAGAGVMNYTPVLGWYYVGPGKRSPAWSGVAFFHNFLVGNGSLGPYAAECASNDIETGDFVQLSFDGEEFNHTLVIVDAKHRSAPESILICAHTFDSLDRALGTYAYKKARFIKILGFRSN